MVKILTKAVIFLLTWEYFGYPFHADIRLNFRNELNLAFIFAFSKSAFVTLYVVIEQNPSKENRADKGTEYQTVGCEKEDLNNKYRCFRIELIS